MNLPLEFFDIFGVFTFAFLLVTGLLIKFKRRISRNYLNLLSLILIIIGMAGLIVDGAIVIVSYFIK